MFQFNEFCTPSENDEFVSNHPLCNLLQSSSWAKIKSNWNHIYTSMSEDNKIVATAMILVKPLPFGFTLFYIPRGPIMDYNNLPLMKAYFKELVNLGKKHRCLYIKFDPSILKNQYTINEPNEQTRLECEKTLRDLKSNGALHLGFSKDIKSVIQPRYQANVYASNDFQDNLPRHTKRLMNDAIKRGVQIEMKGIDSTDEFANVVSKTESRKKISLRNHEYFNRLMETYGDDAKIVLGVINLKEQIGAKKKQLDEAEHEIKLIEEHQVKKLKRVDDQIKSIQKDLNELSTITLSDNEESDRVVIAGCLSIKFGDTMEMLYAGMDDRFKKMMPQYLIYVNQMQWAFDHGCRYCNMGGVEGTLDDGLTKFKSNFNPLIDEYIGEFDLPVNKLLYKSSQWAYKIKKNMKIAR